MNDFRRIWSSGTAVKSWKNRTHSLPRGSGNAQERSPSAEPLRCGLPPLKMNDFRRKRIQSQMYRVIQAIGYMRKCTPCVEWTAFMTSEGLKAFNCFLIALYQLILSPGL